MKEKIINSSRGFFNALLHKKLRLPKEIYLNRAIKNLTNTERVFFWGFFLIMVGTTFLFLFQLNTLASVKVPRQGGEVTEGVIGVPRYINPLLARSKADKNLSSLIYSGLMKYTPEKGLSPALAKSYDISEDGLTYTFTLKENIYFHDGEPIQAEDVVFTIKKAKDSTLESSKRGNWSGVKVEKSGDKKVEFTLRQPYAPFIHNTTLGILPKHIWQNIPSNRFSLSRFNIQPVGSGPYKVANVKRSSSGLTESYRLKKFKKYPGETYINNVNIRFYPNSSSLLEDYEKGKIDNVHSISANRVDKVAKKDSKILHTPLPRVFGVFFNQNQAKIFAEREVREALSKAVDKESIVNKVFKGYATPLKGPMPSNTLKGIKMDSKKESKNVSDPERIEEAKKILEKNGWGFNEEKEVWQTGGENPQTLSFSMSTSNLSELKETAKILKSAWEKLGAKVTIKTFEAGDLNQNVIRPRDYEALLFGEVVGQALDLYPFWHSSQQNDPGLNVAMYANITADKLLEEARRSLDSEKRTEKYKKFLEEVEKDKPAIFLYSPHFTYLTNKNIKNIKIGGLSNSSERFMNIRKWYTKTNNIWKFLVD